MRYLDLLPVATSSGNIGSTVTEGFTFSTNNPNTGIWLGFDKNPNTVFRSGIDGVGYAQVSFPKEFLIGKYVITVGFGYQAVEGGDMKSWRIDAFINNSWVAIHTASHAAVKETLEFEFTPVKTNAIRITATSRHATNSFGFAEFSLYEIVYDSKALIYQDGLYKTYQEDAESWKSLGSTEPTKEVFLEKGIEMRNRTDFSMFNSLSAYELLYLSDNPKVSHIEVANQVEPFSVYDYIGELPVVIVHSETMDDIAITTGVETFNIYDDFKDEVEILYYTNNPATTGANTILDANWSPVDELEDTFDIVSWTDEMDAKRALGINAIPKPQFTYSQDLIPLDEFIGNLQVIDLSSYEKDSMVRLLMSNNNINWYTWNGNNFIAVDNTSHDNIINQGMTPEAFNDLTPLNLTKWLFDAVNVGVFLYDDARGKFRSKVSELSIDTQIPSNTSKVEDVNLYILNTTAKINIDLSGLSLTGQVVDDDMTRVQYRVKLNGEPYYPANGEFTALSKPPLNIDIIIKSDEIKIGDWNIIEVEFQDYFGSSDTWSAQFIGKYAGIMFSDPDGNYYSSDVGQVLKYLDFGEILTGQVTEYYEVKLKNEYGFDVRDATLTVNTQNFPRGLKVELSSTNSGVGSEEIAIGNLAVDDEFTFYVRMRSSADTVPNNNSKFDIVVLAIRDV